MNPFVPSVADVPPLPTAPLWERLLFEQPWPVMVLLLCLGLIGAWLTLGRSKRLSVGLAVGGVLGSVILWGVSDRVETVREVVEQQSRALVTAAVNGHEVPLSELLLPGVVLVAPAPVGRIESAQTLIQSSVRRAAPALVSGGVLESRSVQDNRTTARAQVRVRVEPAGGGFVSNSWWLIIWRLDESGPEPRWRASSIESLWIQGAG